MIQTVFLLLVLFGLYKLYNESHLYYHHAMQWIHENSTTALIIGGILFLYMYQYHQSTLFNLTSVLYETSISKLSRGVPGASSLFNTQKGSFAPSSKTTKRSVSGLLKKKVGANQGWKCAKCSVMLDETYEVNHIVPLEKGGSNREDNLEALCRTCHGKISIAEIINKHS